MAEIVFQNPWALSVVLPLAWLILILYSWRRRFKPFGAFLLRLIIIVLLAVALAQPASVPAGDIAASAGVPQRLVVLVDQSASLGQAGPQALQAEAARLVENHPDAFTVYFADRPVLVNRVLTSGDAQAGPAATTLAQSDTLDFTVSNLAEALTLGAELLHSQPGRLVLLSDGVPTAGDTQKTMDNLAQKNIPVDVLLLDEGTLKSWQNAANDVLVTEVSVPPVLRQGETFGIDVFIHTQTPTDVTLNLKQANEVLAEDVITLEPGLNRFTFNGSADTLGPQTFRATIAADVDSRPENNSHSAFSQVYPTPRVLIVADDANEGNFAAGLLQNSGFEVVILNPSEVPSRLSELDSFDGMVLLDVSAKLLQLEQMIAIQEFVRSLGRGLVVAGGRDSYDLGGYEDTPLEELLPVSLDPPIREERPPVALMLVIDHSGSMAEERGDVATRLTMAKEAAIRAMDFLGPEDLIGILMFDTRHEWVVPFQQVSEGVDLLEMQQKIARIQPGGGTRILRALTESIPALIEQQTAASRLAVLLTDGRSHERESTIDDYNEIVDQALDANITLSTIAIGTGADVELAQHLAERGRGRFHFAEFPEDLPQLTVSESDILRTNALQEGDFGLAITGPHPIIRGLFSSTSAEGQAEAPVVKGYLAMTPRPDSEIVLQIGPGDPLLAVWGYGLGRVVAWSSDSGKEWTGDWRNWPEFARFWGQIVGYTLPAPDLSLLQVDALVEADGAVTLSADGVTSTGQPVDFAPTGGTLVTPGNQENAIQLQQTAPGFYERTIRVADTGAYQITVNQSRGEEPDETATSGFVFSYPAEYGLPPENSGPALLTEIAALTKGRTFELGQINPAATVAKDAATLPEPQELWPWFLLTALILWPVEIAWRRWAGLRIQ